MLGRLQQLVRIATELTANTIPVAPLLPGLKKPKPNARGEWDILADPELVAAAVEAWVKQRGAINLAMLLGRPKGSPVIALGLDLYKDKTAADTARSLGVTSDASVWIQRTGRGGNTIFYRQPSVFLKRDTTQQGASIDLLVNGLAVIPPSHTGQEPDGGGPYRWITGHSPFDIAFAELDEPPAGLLQWWEALSAPRGGKTDKAPQYAVLGGSVIREGSRNAALVRIYGHLLRRLPSAEAARLLHDVNRSRCAPALPENEVDAIVRSIDKKDGASHALRPVPFAPLP